MLISEVVVGKLKWVLKLSLPRVPLLPPYRLSPLFSLDQPDHQLVDPNPQ